MTSSQVVIETGEGMTEELFQTQLENLSRASHALMARAMAIGKKCQHPDIAMLQQAAAFAEIAAHNGRAFRKLPPDPDEPIFPGQQGGKTPKIQ